MKRLMKLLITFFSIIAVLLLTQCTNQEKNITIDSENESRYYSVIHDAYYNECALTFFEFSQILELLNKAKETSDIVYLNGRIDGYKGNGTYIFSLIEENIDYTKQPVIDSKFKDSIFDVIKYMDDYLTKVNEILKSNDINSLNEYKPEFNELHSIMTKIDIEDTLYNEDNKSTDNLDLLNKVKKLFVSSKLLTR